MKKSWHPLLMKNQERVWLEEKKAVRGVSTHELTSYIDAAYMIARGEKEAGSTSQRERGRASTAGVAEVAGGADGQKANGEIGLDVCDPGDREWSEPQ